MNNETLTGNDQRGDFEADRTDVSVPNSLNSASIVIPEINVRMQSQPITAKTKKLKAVWTPEFAQDLNAYHSVDAEGELTAMLSEYVSMEIDLEILDMLITSAASTDFWSAKVGQEYSTSSGTFSQSQFSGQAYIQGTWFATLGTKVQKISNQIHAKTLRGGANFLVTSPAISTILESIPGYAADTDGNKMKYKITYDESLLNYLSKIGYDEVYGARPLKRAIQDKVEDLLSEEVLTDKIIVGKTYVIKVEDEVVKVVKKGR